MADEVSEYDIERRANVEIYNLLGHALSENDSARDPFVHTPHPETNMVRHRVNTKLRNLRALIMAEPYIDIKLEEKENNDN